ncbi:MAG TPA: SDR family NAD(P)-dependent oxidoreductase, partial [Gemmataceae bacterium]|nr:SDR family NAD(P)-dependent oxidoreductase [Gemmataceae bacterium]
IGLAIATAQASESAAVTVNGQAARRVEAAAAAIRREVPGAKVSGVAADLGTAGGAAALVRQARAVGVLDNNVGTFKPVAFAAISDDTWRHTGRQLCGTGRQERRRVAIPSVLVNGHLFLGATSDMLATYRVRRH